tara:strand:- start:1408 stop:3720 length:2313 start_codon:yes stop_codon:yes gene_type:complete
MILILKMNYIFYFIFTITLLYPSQTESIQGFIVNRDGQFIENATIYLEDSNIYTTSDSKGYFRMDVPTEDNYSILISHIGYEEFRITVNGSLESQRIILEVSPISNESITIRENRNLVNLKNSPIVTHLISESEIIESGASDVMEILESALPNIQVIHDSHGNNGIKIQGYNSKDIAFLIDGKRVSGEFAGNIDFSMFDISNISRIEVIRGGMSTIYGSGAVGGVINFITKHKTSNLWIEYNHKLDNPIIESVSRTIGLNYKKISLSFNMSNKYSNGYDLTPMEASEAGRIDKTLEESSTSILSNNITYNINKYNQLNFNTKWYTKKINKYQKTTYPDEVESNGVIEEGSEVLGTELPVYKDLQGSINYTRYTSDSSFISMTYDYESYEREIRYPYWYGTYPHNQGSRTFNVSNPRFFKLSNLFSTKVSSHNLMIGYEAIYNKVSSDNVQYSYSDTSVVNIYNDLTGDFIPDTTFSIIVDTTYNSIFNIDTTYSSTQHSLFIVDNFKYSERLHVTAGLRLNYDHSSESNIHFSPSLGLKKDFNKVFLRANFSSNYRTPSVKELYYDFSAHTPPIFGNPKLTAQRSNYLGFSLENKEKSILEFYYNHNYDMIKYVEIDPDISINGDEYLQTFNLDEIVFFGSNLSHGWNQGNFSFKFTYSYTGAPNKYKDSLNGVSQHSIKSYASYSITDNILLRFSNRYLSDKKLYGISLDSYSISNLFLSYDFKSYIYIKFGIKNIFNFKDERRLDRTDILTSYDPGKRYFINLTIKTK